MLSSFELLIVDGLGFGPVSTGSELLLEVFSRRAERSANAGHQLPRSI